MKNGLRISFWHIIQYVRQALSLNFILAPKIHFLKMKITIFDEYFAVYTIVFRRTPWQLSQELLYKLS
jgi:hypothetical protein